MIPKNLTRSLILVIAALLASTPGALAQSQHSQHSSLMDRDTFNADMRKLWEDHVTWTRLYIVSALGGLPDKDATAKRLLQNQADLGNAIKPFYGDAAGTQLTGLLRDHILIAADLIEAAKAGDSAKQDAATKRWFANADDIATFLAGANPKSWPLADGKKMMRDHLTLTTQEVVAHLKKDWAASIASYDEIHTQILHMADMLSSGIEAQFPDKFKA
ncbi:MAG: glycosyltransferase [Thermoanaerobaculia bacterium]